jgi:hypothetical protein
MIVVIGTKCHVNKSLLISTMRVQQWSLSHLSHNSFKQIMLIDHFSVAVINININAESVQILMKILTRKKQIFRSTGVGVVVWYMSDKSP